MALSWTSTIRAKVFWPIGVCEERACGFGFFFPEGGEGLMYLGGGWRDGCWG